jgi:hypothetical protein
MKDFIKIDSIVVVCITALLLTIVLSAAYYQINDRNLMSKNIADAISAGVNPLSVRCSYAKSDDAVCVAYSFSGRSTPMNAK